jgi:hypothetical protein
MIHMFELNKGYRLNSLLLRRKRAARPAKSPGPSRSGEWGIAASFQLAAQEAGVGKPATAQCTATCRAATAIARLRHEPGFSRVAVITSTVLFPPISKRVIDEVIMQKLEGGAKSRRVMVSMPSPTPPFVPYWYYRTPSGQPPAW